MALIKCPECGKEVSDKAAACPNCGCPITVEKEPQTTESKLIVYGFKQAAIGGNVKLYLDNKYVITVEKYEKVELNIDHDCELSAKMLFNKSKHNYSVKAGRLTKVQILWDRASGNIHFQEVE